MRKEYRNYNKSYSKKEEVKEDFVKEDDVPITDAGQDNEEPKEDILEKVFEEETKTGKVVNCEMVNVRTQPNSTCPIATIINRDEEVTIYSGKSTDDYYAVVTSYKIPGFINKDFIELV